MPHKLGQEMFELQRTKEITTRTISVQYSGAQEKKFLHVICVGWVGRSGIRQVGQGN